MTAQAYIQSKLEELEQPFVIEKPKNDEALAEAIFKALTTKKFRKYALAPERAGQIKGAVAQNIKNGEPIKLTLVFGGYKIWRLEETPEVDWAELFALMYYTKWMQPICALYKPGVWFDFFSDDVAVPILNNISPDDTKAYQASFGKLLEFLKPHQPQNLRMTLNRVGDQYPSYEAFEADLQQQINHLRTNLQGGLPVLNEVARTTLELNVRLTPEQASDPLWREKVQLTHDAYAQVGGRRPYYRTADKITVFTTPLSGALAVGTTKDSIMKFWIGAGVLKPKDTAFRQLVLSPNQLELADFAWEEMAVDGLTGKNFGKIRVLKNE